MVVAGSVSEGATLYASIVSLAKRHGRLATGERHGNISLDFDASGNARLRE
jgi:hypothetical protein